jgi:predicted DNA-binding transcriptional regulator AlpA
MKQYLTTKELAKMTGTSPGHWHNLRHLGGGPKFFKIGAAVRYKLSDVEAWLEPRQFDNAAQAKAAAIEGVE